jgi:hypothetical protein
MISALLIVLISEIAKRDSLIAAVIASIPLISLMAFIWIYIETKDVKQIADLSVNIFWLVIPSLALFVSLPILLKQGFHFSISLGLSVCLTVFCYFIMLLILKRFGVSQ